MDEVKKLCTSLRRNAKEERVLFHYNGHGVPRPTVNGEIWVFNKVGAPSEVLGSPARVSLCHRTFPRGSSATGPIRPWLRCRLDPASADPDVVGLDRAAGPPCGGDPWDRLRVSGEAWAAGSRCRLSCPCGGALSGPRCPVWPSGALSPQEAGLARSTRFLRSGGVFLREPAIS